MEQIGQKMSFERSVQQEPVKRGILAKGADNLTGHVPEESAIVAALRQFVHLYKPPLTTQGGFLFVQNRVVEVFLAHEMAEQNSFAYAGGRGNVLGFGAAKSVARKAIDGHAEKLPAAVFAGHPRCPIGSLIRLGRRSLGQN